MIARLSTENQRDQVHHVAFIDCIFKFKPVANRTKERQS